MFSLDASFLSLLMPCKQTSQNLRQIQNYKKSVEQQIFDRFLFLCETNVSKMRNPHQMAGRDDYLHHYAGSCIFMIRGQVLGNCHRYLGNSFLIYNESCFIMTIHSTTPHWVIFRSDIKGIYNHHTLIQIYFLQPLNILLS